MTDSRTQAPAVRVWDPFVRIFHWSQAALIAAAWLTADDWKAGQSDCTAKLATPICKIPPTAKMVAAGFNKFKTPNLGEAYRHFTGNELVNAHSAMADVMACRDVYFAIKGAQE